MRDMLRRTGLTSGSVASLLLYLCPQKLWLGQWDHTIGYQIGSSLDQRDFPPGGRCQHASTDSSLITGINGLAASD